MRSMLRFAVPMILGKPGMSVVLTVISLGTRVLLAYLLSSVPFFGVTGIWWAIPIGWILADSVGLIYYFFISLPNFPAPMTKKER